MHQHLPTKLHLTQEKNKVQSNPSQPFFLFKLFDPHYAGCNNLFEQANYPTAAQ